MGWGGGGGVYDMMGWHVDDALGCTEAPAVMLWQRAPTTYSWNPYSGKPGKLSRWLPSQPKDLNL